MARSSQGFVVQLNEIVGTVFIPKYYSANTGRAIEARSESHDYVKVGDLVEAGEIEVATGDEIGKMAYGTGTIPFIRTSDISNWELKADPKQGVSRSIYQQYQKRQDVKRGDVFFVRDGTYLIGTSCIITEHDETILYQSHILKFRVNPDSRLSGPLLLVALSSAAVLTQIRAKQFTSDIIDTLGNRYLELEIAIPKDAEYRKEVEEEVVELVLRRVTLREELRRIPLWAQGILQSPTDEIDEDVVEDQEDAETATSLRNTGFVLNVKDVHANIFIPRYYDPGIERDLNSLGETHSLVSLGDLLSEGSISESTGIEIGKMAYGTGDIPFIRTSDMSNWELKSSPKQGVSEQIYNSNDQDVATSDILLVRDGTYLVGCSCIIADEDPKMLYCGGIYKIRVEDPDRIAPYLLIALLNTPIVRRQMRSKQFTRDIIDTLGRRIFEVLLPIPKVKTLCDDIAERTKLMLQERNKLRSRSASIIQEYDGTVSQREKPITVRESSPFLDLARKLAAVPKEEYDREAEAVKNGKPLKPLAKSAQ